MYVYFFANHHHMLWLLLCVCVTTIILPMMKWLLYRFICRDDLNVYSFKRMTSQAFSPIFMDFHILYKSDDTHTHSCTFKLSRKRSNGNKNEIFIVDFNCHKLVRTILWIIHYSSIWVPVAGRVRLKIVCIPFYYNKANYFRKVLKHKFKFISKIPKYMAIFQ